MAEGKPVPIKSVRASFLILKVNNEGTVNVGGNSSIGLLGLAYREDAVTGAPKVNEFGGRPGEGTTNIVNKGNINLQAGTGNVGVYAVSGQRKDMNTWTYIGDNTNTARTVNLDK